jgi:hypothetical protein
VKLYSDPVFPFPELRPVKLYSDPVFPAAGVLGDLRDVAVSLASRGAGRPV